MGINSPPWLERVRIRDGPAFVGFSQFFDAVHRPTGLKRPILHSSYLGLGSERRSWCLHSSVVARHQHRCNWTNWANSMTSLSFFKRNEDFGPSAENVSFGFGPSDNNDIAHTAMPTLHYHYRHNTIDIIRGEFVDVVVEEAASSSAPSPSQLDAPTSIDNELDVNVPRSAETAPVSLFLFCSISKERPMPQHCFFFHW